MKANIFVAALLLLIVGCKQQQSDQLTHQQKDQIKSELKVVLDSIIVSSQRLDYNVAFSYMWNSADFVMYNQDGSHTDFQTAKKSALDEVASLADLKTSWEPGMFRVLNKDLVICSLVGKADITFKSGDKMKEDPDVYSWIFRKIDGQWKVIYSHESGIFNMEKAGKK